MADYTLHLGYNWDSPTIGSVWTTEHRSERFLQYALADASGAAGWFRFQRNDTLSVQIWDLSPRASPVPSAWACNLSLSPLDQGDAGTYDPSTYLSSSSSVARVQTRGSNPYLEFQSIGLSYGSDNVSPPWGACRGGSSVPLGPLTFLSDSASFKLSLYVSATASRNGDPITEVFLSDPEVIVGSQGSSRT